jgi:uncharacterized protein YndB with AHSA1/START domain
MMQTIEISIPINASISTVWNALTNPTVMKQWMGEPDMKIEIDTDWKEGGPIVIEGFHHVAFKNYGTVLKFEANQKLRYSHLSSLSGLPDIVDNYSIFDFSLSSSQNQTFLSLTIKNFPTESIYKHLDFYWKGTIPTLKDFIESH